MNDSERYANAFDTLPALADVVCRLIQEVEVLKVMLKSRGVWNVDEYRRTMEEVVIQDHSAHHFPHRRRPYSCSAANCGVSVGAERW